MGVVQGLTKARMLAIEAASVISGAVVGDNLVLTKFDGSTINAGAVKGAKGDKGDTGAGFSVIEIGNAINLNDVLVNGFYTQTEDAQALSGSNYPVPNSGLLEVTTNPTNTLVWQRYTVYNGSIYAGVVYSRTKSGTTWTAWSALGGGALPPIVVVKATTAQSMAQTTEVPIVFQQGLAGWWSYATNPERITVPEGFDGRYTVIITYSFAGNTSGSRIPVLRKNNVTQESWSVGLGTVTPVCGTISSPIDLVAGDYIHFNQYQSSGGALNTYTQPYPSLKLVPLKLVKF